MPISLRGLPQDASDFILARCERVRRPNPAECRAALETFHEKMLSKRIATGASVHRGDRNEQGRRGGITYTAGGCACVCADVEVEGVRVSFYRGGAEPIPYPGQKLVTFTKKDWSGWLILTSDSLEDAVRFASESAALAQGKPVAAVEGDDRARCDHGRATPAPATVRSGPPGYGRCGRSK